MLLPLLRNEYVDWLVRSTRVYITDRDWISYRWADPKCPFLVIADGLDCSRPLLVSHRNMAKTVNHFTWNGIFVSGGMTILLFFVRLRACPTTQVSSRKRTQAVFLRATNTTALARIQHYDVDKQQQRDEPSNYYRDFGEISPRRQYNNAFLGVVGHVFTELTTFSQSCLSHGDTPFP